MTLLKPAEKRVFYARIIMANAETIDSLLVSLGLDVDQKSFQKATDAINDVKNKSLQLLAAAGVGVGFDAWTRGVARYTGEIESLSFATKTATRDVEALRHAFKAQGFAVSEADSALRRMADVQRNIQMGQLPAFPGSDVLIGKTPVQMLQTLAEMLPVMDEQMRIRALQEMGITPGSSLEKMISGGGSAFSKQIESARAGVSGISPELSADVAEFNQQMANLQTNFNELSKAMGKELIPPVNEILSIANNFIKAHPDLIKAGVEIVGLLAGLKTAAFLVRGLSASLLALTGPLSVLIAALYPAQTVGQEEEESELKRLQRQNWERNNPGIPFPGDRVMGHLSLAPGASASDFMTGDDVPQFAQSTNAGGRPLGIRNRNPGNLRFAGQAGASPGEGGFAQFETQEAGLSALHRQLGLYFKRGKNTISSIVNTYAPGSENDVPAYIRALTKATGKGEHETLDFNDAETVKKLMHGIVTHEVGRGHVSMADIEGAVGGGGTSFGGDESASFAQGAFSSPSDSLPGSSFSPTTQKFEQTNHVVIESTGNPERDQKNFQLYTRNAKDAFESDIY